MPFRYGNRTVWKIIKDRKDVLADTIGPLLLKLFLKQIYTLADFFSMGGSLIYTY